MRIDGPQHAGAAMRGRAPGAADIDHAAAARQIRQGPLDPTTAVEGSVLWRASWTPDGPGTVRVAWAAGLDIEHWGPGGPWLAERSAGMVGLTDTVVTVSGHHDVVDGAERRHPALRIARSGCLYHDLLPTVLAQRVTGLEAAHQWRDLCRALGAPAPGPRHGLLTPPPPDELSHRPAWWFHRLGVEARRADVLRLVARHADRWHRYGSSGAALGATDAAEAHDVLQRLPGIGPWTAGVAVGVALGHPDEIPVGDYHLKNIVASALTGRPRGTDEEMVRLLEPFRGQRNRVVHLLLADGHRAPLHGPRQRIRSIRGL